MNILGSAGAAYTKFVRHSNDQFVYLLGRSSTNVGLIHVLSHNTGTGLITKTNTVTKAGTINAFDGNVSPDGKFLAVNFLISDFPCPTCSRSIVIYSIDQADGSLTEKYSLVENSVFANVQWLKASQF